MAANLKIKEADLIDAQRKNQQMNQEKNKLEQEKRNLQQDNSNKEKNLNTATLNIQENERVRRKLDTSIKNLENEKKRLLKEKLDAIKEKDDAKAYMNSLTRDFDWLKKRTDEEQANIIKLERDRQVLKTNLTNLEDKHTKNKNALTRKDNLIQTLNE